MHLRQRERLKETLQKRPDKTPKITHKLSPVTFLHPCSPADFSEQACHLSVVNLSPLPDPESVSQFSTQLLPLFPQPRPYSVLSYQPDSRWPPRPPFWLALPTYLLSEWACDCSWVFWWRFCSSALYLPLVAQVACRLLHPVPRTFVCPGVLAVSKGRRSWELMESQAWPARVVFPCWNQRLTATPVEERNLLGWVMFAIGC